MASALGGAGRAMLAGAIGSSPPPVPAGMDPRVAALFSAVDSDRSGQISASELQAALSSGGWKPFDLKTCLLMIKMFDADGSKSISIDEFNQLWSYLQKWKASFDGIDADRSGSVDMRELWGALTAMGYRLSAEAFNGIVRAYDEDRSGSIGFDEFVRLFSELTILTAAFARVDVRRTGTITLTYDQYLQMIMSTR